MFAAALPASDPAGAYVEQRGPTVVGVAEPADAVWVVAVDAWARLGRKARQRHGRRRRSLECHMGCLFAFENSR